MPVRRILLVLSLLGCAVIAGFTIRASFTTSKPKDLAEPLSEKETADLATALPAIDEIRRHNGSVLEGTLLDTLDDPKQAIEPDKDSEEFVQLLRREARRLDDLAADKEDGHNFLEADALRAKAQGMRESAREMRGVGGFTVNR
jgi:hypothetical protein